MKGSLDNVRDQVRECFEQNGFKITWQNDLKARAQKGSEFMNQTFPRLFGKVKGWYYLVDFEISGSADSWNVRLIKADPGHTWMDKKEVNRDFERLVRILANKFGSQGLLIEVTKS